MSDSFVELSNAIDDDRFVDVDLALRRGRHIDREDADWYGYLLDARQVLEPFYQRYACELVHRTDGYFFLLPLGEKVPKRQLGLPEMIVGQGAALLYLDPSTIESGGIVSKHDVLSHLAAVMGTDTLVAAFNPKRKRLDERVAQEVVRQRVGEGLRKLAQLGFVEQLDNDKLRLRSALMRFADPVRAAGSPRDALERLVARGEVSLAPALGQEGAEDAEGAEDDALPGVQTADETAADDGEPSLEDAQEPRAMDDDDDALDDDDDALDDDPEPPSEPGW